MDDDNNNDIYNIEKIIKFHIYKNKAHLFFSMEDAYQIGYMGYLKAKKKWNKEGHAKLTLNYVSKYIHGEIFKEVEKVANFKRNVILNNESVEDYEDSYEPFKEDGISLKIRECLTELSPLEKSIIEDYYLNGNKITFRELMSKYGISKQRLAIIKDRALSILKDAYLAK